MIKKIKKGSAYSFQSAYQFSKGTASCFPMELNLIYIVSINFDKIGEWRKLIIK